MPRGEGLTLPLPLIQATHLFISREEAAVQRGNKLLPECLIWNRLGEWSRFSPNFRAREARARVRNFEKFLSSFTGCCFFPSSNLVLLSSSLLLYLLWFLFVVLSKYSSKTYCSSMQVQDSDFKEPPSLTFAVWQNSWGGECSRCTRSSLFCGDNSPWSSSDHYQVELLICL